MKLFMARGDTPAWEFAVRDTAGNPQTLVGATVRFSARQRLADPAALFERSIGSGVTIDDATGGKLTVRLAEANTSSFTTPRTLYWDLEVVDGAGNRITVADGLLFVRMDVSR